MAPFCLDTASLEHSGLESLQPIGYSCFAALPGDRYAGGLRWSGRDFFDDTLVAQSVGVVALAFILFAGGVETEWQVVRPALLSLSTIGVLLTAVVVAVFALLVLHVSFLEGLLLGAIISATDAAAVFSVLGARNLRLTGKLLPLLELESGTNAMVLDNWGDVDRWVAEAEITSHGLSGIGFVNFGTIHILRVERTIETFGRGARGFNAWLPLPNSTGASPPCNSSPPRRRARLPASIA